MAKIEKKVLAKYFQQILDGKKKFELRLGDFDVAEGDTLVLTEIDDQTKEPTGRVLEKQVTYVLKFHPEKLPFWPADEVKKHGLQIISIE